MILNFTGGGDRLTGISEDQMHHDSEVSGVKKNATA